MNKPFLLDAGDSPVFAQRVTIIDSSSSRPLLQRHRGELRVDRKERRSEHHCTVGYQRHCSELGCSNWAPTTDASWPSPVLPSMPCEEPLVRQRKRRPDCELECLGLGWVRR